MRVRINQLRWRSRRFLYRATLLVAERGDDLADYPIKVSNVTHFKTTNTQHSYSSFNEMQ